MMPFIPLQPDEIPHKISAAIQLYNGGQQQQAEAICTAVLQIAPDNSDALHLLGLWAHEKGDLGTAVTMLQKAVQSNPKIIAFHYNLGMAWLQQGDLKKAMASFKNTLTIPTDNDKFYFKIANLFRKLNQREASILFFRQVLVVNPDNIAALNNMANSLREMGHLDEAVECYQKAVQLNPSIPELYNNLGETFRTQGDAEKSFAAFQKAIALRPDYGEALNNMGFLLHRTGNLTQATIYYHKALEFIPTEAGVYHNLGNIAMALGNFQQAIASYSKAISLKADFAAAHSNILFSMNYDPLATPKKMHLAARQWWQQQAAAFAVPAPGFGNPGNARRKLRIGYVSPDLNTHSVNFFFLPLITHHDKETVESFCYSDTIKEDGMTEQVKTAANHWRRVVGMNDGQVAQLIINDKIDILVDLAGHTSNNRLLVFARRPAPIQATWLGYPNTTGLETMDYRFTDAIADPEGDIDQYYSEKLIRLPHGFLCYTPPQEAPEVGRLPAIDNNHITFGSFNNLAKISADVIAAWAEILQKTPNSQLVLKSFLLTDETLRGSKLALFEKHGVAADRIRLLPRTKTLRDHLELYNAIDIALDSFPYNGTTTTCESLWMGVPVLTILGSLHAARVSASILTRIGHSDLIAESKNDYVSKAVALALDTERLKEIRKKLRRQVADSRLCEPARFARDMETAYRQFWQDRCQKSSEK